MENIKFIADCMLGKLSRWLRIIGYDTQYVRFLSDIQLLAQARYQGRILLTKDTVLYKKAGQYGFLVQSKSIEKQINEIMTHFHLQPNLAISRCPSCNNLLQIVNKNELSPPIPLYINRSFPLIKICPGCNQAFWPGTHWQNIMKKLSYYPPKNEG